MIVGPKAPLKAEHIWEIRTRLKMAAKLRDLALFNLAIDSKLRGCDVVKLRIADVMAGGTIRLRSTVVQQKTGQPVPFELTDPTREAPVDWLKIRRAVGCDWLFPSRRHAGEHLTTRQ
jgi:integrase